MKYSKGILKRSIYLVRDIRLAKPYSFRAEKSEETALKNNANDARALVQYAAVAAARKTNKFCEIKAALSLSLSHDSKVENIDLTRLIIRGNSFNCFRNKNRLNVFSPIPFSLVRVPTRVPNTR